MMPNACYVYAILSRGAPVPPDLFGIGGAALTTVPWLELAAAISHFDSVTLPPTPEHVLHHETVVEGLRRSGPALPVRFGTVLADLGAVQRALSDRYAELLADLGRLGDKVELGLTVLWDGADKGEEGGCAEPASVSLRSASGQGTRYLAGRLAEHRRVTLLQSRGTVLARELDDALKSQALDSRRTVLPTPRLLLRAVYLMEPGGVAAFQDAFDAVRVAHQQFRFLLSGPWPPYSFVTPPQAKLLASLDYLGTDRVEYSPPHGGLASDPARS